MPESLHRLYAISVEDSGVSAILLCVKYEWKQLPDKVLIENRQKNCLLEYPGGDLIPEAGTVFTDIEFK